MDSKMNSIKDFGHMGSVAVTRNLVALWHIESSRLGIETVFSGEVHALRLEDRLHSPQLEKAHEQQQRCSAAKNKQ